MIEAFIRCWYSAWLWLAYAMGVRHRWNSVVRWLDRDTPRVELEQLLHPSDLADHLSDWDWRRDGTRIGGLFVPVDYVSRPEVTEARIRDKTVTDGDCDDAHHYAAVQLERMSTVDAAYHVTIGYRSGGHLACVWRFRGNWWLLNYGKLTFLSEGPHQAAEVLMDWAGHAGERPRWFAFENTALKRVRP